MSRSQTQKILEPISTPLAPPASGPYSQAIKVGDMLYVSGCIPLNVDGHLVGPGDVKKQTVQVLANLKAVTEAGGSHVDKIIKTIVFLKDVNDFAIVNATYAEFFGTHKPARSTVEVARLPLGVLLEIEAIALSDTDA